MWKTVENTNGKIEVNELGEIRSLLRGAPRVLKTQVSRKGYHKVRLTIERRKFSLTVHREVAKAFIPNPLNLPQVNHKDGDKSNNRADNLEWCTNKENARHALDHGLWDSVVAGAKRENERRKTPIVAYKKNGEPSRILFKSVSDAERAFDSRHICDVLKGKRAHVKGWTFEYATKRGVI